jgi:hypothetical protein
MVTVLVGNVEVEVNEVPLFRQSALFRRAWAAERGEGQMAIMTLPETDPRHFLLYKHWLYTGELSDAELGYYELVEEDRISIQLSIIADNLIHLWALGELLGDHELEETIMTELDRWYVDNCIPSVISDQTVAFVDRITKANPGSPIRQFLFRRAKCLDDPGQTSQVAQMWMSDISQEEERHSDARARELELTRELGLAKEMVLAKELELAKKLKLLKGFELEKRRKDEVAEARRLRRAQNAPQRKKRKMAKRLRKKEAKKAAALRQQ